MSTSTRQQKTPSTIVKDGSTYLIFGDVGIADNLPNKVLDIKLGQGGSIYLQESSDIVLPDKIYSNDTSFIKHVLKTYSTVNGSLGILLSGKKGLGKSFTANIICQTLGLPVIRITSKIKNEYQIFNFLNKITQEHIVFIDEFEKIFADPSHYRPDEDSITQQDFLSYLDNGTVTTKRLFLITSNDKVSEFLMNRPSRIRYNRAYDEMAIETINEIIDDLLVNKDFKDDLVENVSNEHVNIDALVKIIEEINIHNVPYSEFKDFFNYKNGEANIFDIYENGELIFSEEKVTIQAGRTSYVMFYHPETENPVYMVKIIDDSYTGITAKVWYNNNEDVKTQSQMEFRRRYGRLL